MYQILLKFQGKKMSFHIPTLTKPEVFTGELHFEPKDGVQDYHLLDEKGGIVYSFTYSNIGFVFTDLQSILSITKKPGS